MSRKKLLREIDNKEAEVNKKLEWAMDSARDVMREISDIDVSDKEEDVAMRIDEVLCKALTLKEELDDASSDAEDLRDLRLDLADGDEEAESEVA